MYHLLCVKVSLEFLIICNDYEQLASMVSHTAGKMVDALDHYWSALPCDPRGFISDCLVAICQNVVVEEEFEVGISCLFVENIRKVNTLSCFQKKR